MKSKLKLEKIYETKSLFFEKINLIDKPPTRQTRKKEDTLLILRVREGISLQSLCIIKGK